MANISRLKIIHVDMVTALEGILNPIGAESTWKKLLKYCNIWDDQIDEMIKGTGYSFGYPAAFVEVDLGDCKMLGAGYSSYPNCIIRIHILHEFLNSRGGKMEQNLPVFDVRDLIKQKFTGLGIRFCSTLMCSGDKLDYKHNNTYKYILEFNTNFQDNRGGELDENSGSIWERLVNPTINLNIFYSWISGKSYVANESVVSYLEQYYLCVVDNSDTIFNIDKWIEIKDWIAGYSFVVDDYCAFESNVYKCIIPNSDTIFDINNWELIPH